MKTSVRRAAVCLLTIVGLISPAWPWGNEGHSAINRVAAEKLPPEVPAFLRNASAQLAYLAPEPDRWRETTELALKCSQEPDHFIDLELIEGMELPPDRYSFYRELEARRQQIAERPSATQPTAVRPPAVHPDDLLPERVGMQPYIAMEVYGRLVVAFREYRLAMQERRSPDFAEANAIFYAGWLGHYVGDAANPLHTTIHHNGWVGPNPNGYTTSNTVHWKMEGIFVAANFKQLQFADLVSQPRLLSDPFQDYLRYLHDSHQYVETAYQLEKAGGFDGEGTAASRDFIRQRLAAGATMLRDMWYSAWVQSGQQSGSTQAPAAAPATPAPNPAPAKH